MSQYYLTVLCPLKHSPRSDRKEKAIDAVLLFYLKEMASRVFAKVIILILLNWCEGLKTFVE